MSRWIRTCLSICMIVVVGALAGCVPNEPPADRKELVRETQTLLAAQGYKPGPADGVMGDRTRSAIRKYQRENGLPVNGRATPELYRSLAAGGGGVSRPAGASRKQREDARRRELSRNDPVVRMHSSCKGLFIPEVGRKMYRGAVPVYYARFLNNSKNRYRVTYDFTYRIRGRNYYGRIDETFTDEKSATVRPEKFVEFLLVEQNKGGGTQVTGISDLTVLRCART